MNSLQRSYLNAQGRNSLKIIVSILEKLIHTFIYVVQEEQFSTYQHNNHQRITSLPILLVYITSVSCSLKSEWFQLYFFILYVFLSTLHIQILVIISVSCTKHWSFTTASFSYQHMHQKQHQPTLCPLNRQSSLDSYDTGPWPNPSKKTGHL